MASIKWYEEPHLKCEISLNPNSMGQLTLTIIDEEGNEFEIGTPEYSFDVNSINSSAVSYSFNKVTRVGNTIISYFGNEVSRVGNTNISISFGKVTRVGNACISYFGSTVSGISGQVK